MGIVAFVNISSLKEKKREQEEQAGKNFKSSYNLYQDNYFIMFFRNF